MFMCVFRTSIGWKTSSYKEWGRNLFLGSLICCLLLVGRLRKKDLTIRFGFTEIRKRSIRYLIILLSSMSNIKTGSWSHTRSFRTSIHFDKSSFCSLKVFLISFYIVRAKFRLFRFLTIVREWMMVCYLFLVPKTETFI